MLAMAAMMMTATTHRHDISRPADFLHQCIHNKAISSRIDLNTRSRSPWVLVPVQELQETECKISLP